MLEPAQAEPVEASAAIDWRRTVNSDRGGHSRLRTDASAVKISVLMPVYNEEATVIQAIRDVLSASYPCEIELIVVNDGSTDRTGSLLSQLKSERVITREHTTNQGKGAALRLAMREASGTHVLPFDADLEYAASDIPRLVQPVVQGRCDVVYGARLRGFNTAYHSYWYAAGNRVMTRLANVLFDSHISDLHTCLKLIPRRMLEQLDLRESGFGLDTEITALLLKHGVRPFEVPISYYSRSRAQGKKITWRDALACVRILARVRVSRRSRLQTAAPGRCPYPVHDMPGHSPEATGYLSSVTNGVPRTSRPGAESTPRLAASAGGADWATMTTTDDAEGGAASDPRTARSPHLWGSLSGRAGG
jgi:dolichol-phosphate hexosyltransferase